MYIALNSKIYIVHIGDKNVSLIEEYVLSGRIQTFPNIYMKN